VPKDIEHFDSDYQNNISDQLDLIRQIVDISEENFTPFNTIEIMKAIEKLNSKKASDECGLYSEHFKLAGQSLLPQLTTLFNAILTHCFVPPQFLIGIITPVHKKGKDATNFTNYRGITVTSTIGKIFEHVLLGRLEHLLPVNQSSLQFGFTKNTSILLAALVINESISKARIPLYLAFLDSQKAFDVVDHQSMKCKIFHNGVRGHIWKIIDTLYSCLTSKVKWNGHLSQPFPILQGVRQGGILSTSLYKTYLNDLLCTLERNRLGTCIGTTFVGCPTVADDIALVASSETDLQLMLNLTNSFANRERYIIHPDKSTVLIKIPSKTPKAKISDWKLGDKKIAISESATHLGLIRSSSKSEIKLNIEDRISSARRTLYSLIGTGVHGTNGLPPTTCLNIFKIYVLPRLLYGLEIYILNQTQFEQLEAYYLNFLRKIQGLPSRSVRGITYLLLGVRPVTAEIHIRQLNLIYSIIRGENKILLQLLHRQLNVRNEDSGSWFIYVNNLLEQYNLPDVKTLLTKIPSKNKWKEDVKKAIDIVWSEKLLSDCENKSILKYCNTSTLKIGTVHSTWLSIQNNIKDVRRGNIKARLLTGNYVLQSNFSKFNQHQVNHTCLLCQVEDEDIVHFLLNCNALHSYRQMHLSEMKQIINYKYFVRRVSNCGYNLLVTFTF